MDHMMKQSVRDTTDAEPSPSAPSSPSNKNRLTIIIVSCIGGFALVLIIVLLVVPYSRRYITRNRSSKQLDSSTERGPARIHQRSVSGPDASMPLLESEDPAFERKLAHGRGADVRHGYTGESSIGSRLFPTSPTAYPVRDNAPEPTASRALRPQPPLRRARTRVGQLQPMDPLPEDSAIMPATSPSLSNPDEHPSWLHIPNDARRPSGNIPLIGAFRSSASSTTSAASLPSMQHYPSFNASAPSSRARSPATFYSLSSGSLASSTAAAQGHRPPTMPSEYGELAPPPARLKPSGGPERVAQIQHVDIYPASRQASFLHAPGGYPTSGSGSTVSVYTDARSRLADDDGDEGAVRPPRLR